MRRQVGRYRDRRGVVTIGEKRRVEVSASTPLGGSAKWSLEVASDAQVTMQAVVSLRPRPIDPNDKADKTKKFVPVGDVSVRIRVERTERDSLRRPHENAWLSVFCIPLTTKNEFTDLVAVQVCANEPAELPVRVAPMRLSDFTPGVWCQFAAVMSRFRVEAGLKSLRRVEDVLDVSALSATLDVAGQTFTIGLNDLPEGETLQTLEVRTESDTHTSAQIEEPIYAVVTRFIHGRVQPPARARHRHSRAGADVDIARQTRVAIFRCGERDTTDMSGRVRLLRVLRGKTRKDGGFESEPREFPQHFFGIEQDESLNAEPLDAAGVVIGISAPIGWGKE